MKTNYHFSNGYCKVTFGENQKTFEMKGDDFKDHKELHKQIKEWQDELERDAPKDKKERERNG
jgi:hypothetical protein